MKRDDLLSDDHRPDADEVLVDHFVDMSEMDMEGFLTDAIETYGEAQRIPELSFSAVPFRRAGLLTQDRGLVIRIGDAEFQVRIVRVD